MLNRMLFLQQTRLWWPRNSQRQILEIFWVFLGTWLIISLHPGYSVPDFFVKNLTQTRDIFWNPLYLSELLSGNWFNAIYCYTWLCNKDPPVYQNKFWQVRKCIDSFNFQMIRIFGPSWMICLDESIVVFMNEHCSGWMSIMCKPHLYGNEYHTIANAITHIIFV